jgi:hypothetical protein
MVLARGTKLGPCVLESLIGKGGMGEIYAAQEARRFRWSCRGTMKFNSVELASGDCVFAPKGKSHEFKVGSTVVVCGVLPLVLLQPG